MIKTFTLIRENRIFQFSVISIILLSSVLVGFQTYEVSKNYVLALLVLDYFVTIFFVFEILIRFLAEEKKTPFLERWLEFI